MNEKTYNAHEVAAKVLKKFQEVIELQKSKKCEDVILEDKKIDKCGEMTKKENCKCDGICKCSEQSKKTVMKKSEKLKNFLEQRKSNKNNG